MKFSRKGQSIARSAKRGRGMVKQRKKRTPKALIIGAAAIKAGASKET